MTERVSHSSKQFQSNGFELSTPRRIDRALYKNRSRNLKLLTLPAQKLFKASHVPNPKMRSILRQKYSISNWRRRKVNLVLKASDEEISLDVGLLKRHVIASLSPKRVGEAGKELFKKFRFDALTSASKTLHTDSDGDGVHSGVKMNLEGHKRVAVKARKKRIKKKHLKTGIEALMKNQEKVGKALRLVKRRKFKQG